MILKEEIYKEYDLKVIGDQFKSSLYWKKDDTGWNLGLSSYFFEPDYMITLFKERCVSKKLRKYQVEKIKRECGANAKFVLMRS